MKKFNEICKSILKEDGSGEDRVISNLSKLGFRGWPLLKIVDYGNDVDLTIKYNVTDSDTGDGELGIGIETSFYDHPDMDKKFNDLIRTEILRYFKKRKLKLLKLVSYRDRDNVSHAKISFENKDPYPIIKSFIKDFEKKSNAIKKQLLDDEKKAKNTPEYKEKLDAIKYEIAWDLNDYGKLELDSLSWQAKKIIGIPLKDAEEILDKLIKLNKIYPIKRGGKIDAWGKYDGETITAKDLDYDGRLPHQP
jgi:hypothetical protein